MSESWVNVWLCFRERERRKIGAHVKDGSIKLQLSAL